MRTTPQQNTPLWASVHNCPDHAEMVAVRVYARSDLKQMPLDELRMVHRALVLALTDVNDAMADLAVVNHVGARETA